MVIGCNARQCARLAPVQRTKLWQLSQQSCHRCCTNAFDRKQIAQVRTGRIALEQSCALRGRLVRRRRAPVWGGRPWARLEAMQCPSCKAGALWVVRR